MTRTITIWAAVIVAILAWVWFASAPRAEDCITVDRLHDVAAGVDARVAGAAVFDGANADMVVIVEGKGAVFLHFFKAGCMIQTIVADGRAAVKPTA